MLLGTGSAGAVGIANRRGVGRGHGHSVGCVKNNEFRAKRSGLGQSKGKGLFIRGNIGCQ